MKPLISMSGKVSHLATISRTAGFSLGGNTTVATGHTQSFRVDGRPATFFGTPSLADGDQVTLIGQEKAGFVAVVLRNDSTGVVYRAIASDWKGGMPGCLTVPIYLFAIVGVWGVLGFMLWFAVLLILNSVDHKVNGANLPDSVTVMTIIISGMATAALVVRKVRRGFSIERQIKQLLGA